MFFAKNRNNRKTKKNLVSTQKTEKKQQNTVVVSQKTMVFIIPDRIIGIRLGGRIGSSVNKPQPYLL